MTLPRTSPVSLLLIWITTSSSTTISRVGSCHTVLPETVTSAAPSLAEVGRELLEQ